MSLLWGLIKVRLNSNQGPGHTIVLAYPRISKETWEILKLHISDTTLFNSAKPKEV